MGQYQPDRIGADGAEWVYASRYREARERVAELEAQRDRLREGLADRDRAIRAYGDGNNNLASECARLRAQRDRLVEALRDVADRCDRWYTSPEIAGAQFASGRTSAMRDCAEWIRAALAELEAGEVKP